VPASSSNNLFSVGTSCYYNIPFAGTAFNDSLNVPPPNLPGVPLFPSQSGLLWPYMRVPDDARVFVVPVPSTTNIGLNDADTSLGSRYALDKAAASSKIKTVPAEIVEHKQCNVDAASMVACCMVACHVAHPPQNMLRIVVVHMVDY
jgi:hypothetical protein